MKKTKQETSHPKTLKLVGDRIRQLRKQNGKTMVELAETCSITVSYLSQIERNLVEPSLSVLRAIARALKTETSLFFVDEVKTDVLITKSCEASSTNIDTLRYRFMMPFRLANGMNTDMVVMTANVQPLKCIDAEILVHAGAEFTTVLEGSLCYLVEDEEIQLSEGDSIYIERNTRHKVYNISDKEAKCLAAIELVSDK